MLCVLDFESDAIEDRPHYPPKPAGLAVLVDNGSPGSYYAWNHPTKNNCSYQYAHATLAVLLDNPDLEFVFHNAPFDC